MSESFRQIAELLSHRIGLDPSTIGERMLARAILDRMGAVGLSDPLAYARFLDSSEAELSELVEMVVVSESWFFRDMKPFEMLAQLVKTKALLDLSRHVFRVLSIPCANGEEPYSIVMTLLDAGLTPDQFHVDAADLSQRALARSAKADYSRSAFRSVDLDFRERFFHVVENNFQLDDSVRRLVRFHHANVLDNDFLLKESPYNVIFCRNLLIYLDAPSRKQVMNGIDRLLTSDGLLFVGHAEATPGLDSRFEAIDDSGSFAYQRATESPKPTLNKSVPPRTRKAAAISIPPGSPSPTSRRTNLANDSDQRIPQSPSLATTHPLIKSSILEHASILANENRFAEAIHLCEQAIRQHGPSPEAYLLMGMIQQATGALDQAESALSKVLYLDPKHEEALLSLALISERRGDARASASYRRRVERARQSKEPR